MGALFCCLHLTAFLVKIFINYTFVVKYRTLETLLARWTKINRQSCGKARFNGEEAEVNYSGGESNHSP